MKLNGNGYEIGEPKFPNGKPLYALHRLTMNPDATVWIVEGEQKADALNSFGLTATTSGGATSTNGTDWEPLRRRSCIIWPDNDDPGKAYAGEVASTLLNLGCSVSCIDVDQLGLGKSDDAVDWLAAHSEAKMADIEALPRIASAINHSSTGNAAIEWPELLPLDTKINSEPYPVDALPDAIRAAVEEVQRFVKAPFSLVASSALGALSIATQALADVRRAEQLVGPVTLFTLTVAESGERKSSCDGYFSSAIRDYERIQADLARPLLAEYQAALSVWESKRSALLDVIRADSKKGRPTGNKENELRQLEADKPVRPRVPRLIYADVTPESLAFNLATGWPSGGITSSEGGIVFGSHGMGRESLMRNLALLNQLWDGIGPRVDRKTSESFSVRNSRLTVSLQIQELTLRSFFDQSKGLARGTGFLARFLMAWPESTMGTRVFSESHPLGHLATFNRRLYELLDQIIALDEDRRLVAIVATVTVARRKSSLDRVSRRDRKRASVWWRTLRRSRCCRENCRQCGPPGCTLSYL